MDMNENCKVGGCERDAVDESGLCAFHLRGGPRTYGGSTLILAATIALAIGWACGGVTQTVINSNTNVKISREWRAYVDDVHKETDRNAEALNAIADRDNRKNTKALVELKRKSALDLQAVVKAEKDACTKAVTAAKTAGKKDYQAGVVAGKKICADIQRAAEQARAIEAAKATPTPAPLPAFDPFKQ